MPTYTLLARNGQHAILGDEEGRTFLTGTTTLPSVLAHPVIVPSIRSRRLVARPDPSMPQGDLLATWQTLEMDRVSFPPHPLSVDAYFNQVNASQKTSHEGQWLVHHPDASV